MCTNIIIYYIYKLYFKLYYSTLIQDVCGIVQFTWTRLDNVDVVFTINEFH